MGKSSRRPGRANRSKKERKRNFNKAKVAHSQALAMARITGNMSMRAKRGGTRFFNMPSQLAELIDVTTLAKNPRSTDRLRKWQRFANTGKHHPLCASGISHLKGPHGEKLFTLATELGRE